MIASPGVRAGNRCCRVLHAVALFGLWVLVPALAIAQNNAVEKSIGALKAGDPSKRMLAARSLRDFRDSRGVEALNAALTADPDPLVRSEIADALNWIACSYPVNLPDRDLMLAGSIRPLVAALGDSDVVVSSSAEKALRRSGPTVIEELVPLLDNERKAVRLAAVGIIISALANFNGKRRVTQAQAGGFSRLSQDLNDTDARIRCKVSSCLGFGYYKVDPSLKAAARAVKRDACAEAKKWNSATRANTSAAYQEFESRYPKGFLAEEARWLASDPAYAFLITFQTIIGGEGDEQERIEGFLRSHGGSPYAALARDYVEFLKAERGHNPTAALQRYRSAHSDSPFAVAARLLSPLLWLKGSQGTLGVVISVAHLENKGLLRGGVGSKEKVTQKLWSKLSQRLSAEGISASLLETPGVNPVEGAPQYQLVVEYSEGAAPSYAYAGSPDLASQLHAAAAQNLADIFSQNVINYYEMKLIDVHDGSVLFPKFYDLDSTISLYDVLPLLSQDPADKLSALMRFLLTLPHVDLHDPQQRDAAKSSLASLTAR